MLEDHLLKTKKDFENQKQKTGDTRYTWKNELCKACFRHDMAYEDLKDLARTTVSDKVLKR